MKKLLNGLDEGTRKLVTMFIRILLVLVVIIIIFMIVSSCTSKRNDYSRLENILSDAAERYYKDKETELPKNEGESKKITATELSNSDYMKSISSYVTDSSCDGYVVVTKNKTNYQYNPIVKCSDYKTNDLASIIMKDLTNTDDGLYIGDDEYYYRGDMANNYIQINKNIYQIISIDSNNKIKVIALDSDREMSIWDDRYNKELGYNNTGINEFERSYIQKYLQELYEKEDPEIKKYMVAHDWCSKKINPEDKIEKKECDSTSKGYIGLIDVYEFARASIDEDCNTLSSKSCINYNYLTGILTKRNLTLSVVSDNTYEIYLASDNGIETADTSDYYSLSKVFYINGENVVTSGEGTKTNPYVLK